MKLVPGIASLENSFSRCTLLESRKKMDVLAIASPDSQVRGFLRLNPCAVVAVPQPVREQECLRDSHQELSLVPGNRPEDWLL
jgi:hypothetical protein